MDESLVKKCERCGRDFKIISQEKAFYEKKGLDLPVKCGECRRERRLGLRNERKLYLRECDKCGKQLMSTYGEGAAYVVYCEECYFGAV